MLSVSNSSSVAGSFNIDTWTIKSENKSNSVFHEMFHAYQAWRYSKSEYDATDANREVEAYLAEYMYAHELEWTTFSERITDLSDEFLTKNGTLVDSSREYDFFSQFAGIALTIKNTYERLGYPTPFEPNRTYEHNIENLARLSKNC